jgi:endonuclease YncB( thermonuclease family)
MARSEVSGTSPQRRGLTWAVSLGAGIILAAILLFKHPSGAAANSEPADAPPEDEANASVWDRIGFAKHKTVAKATDPNAPKLDDVDKKTKAHAAKGAIVGEPTVIGSNLIEVSGKPVVLWAILSPNQNANCYTNGTPWPCGVESIKATNMAVRKHHLVACYDMGADDHNRMVGRCYVGIEDVGGMLVGTGWALADKDVDGAYLVQQSDAKFKRKGLWSSQFRLEEFSGY